jgi:hypothetical protein
MQTGATETPAEGTTEDAPAPKKRRRRRKKPAEAGPPAKADEPVNPVATEDAA